MSFKTSLLCITILLATNNSVFASCSFGECWKKKGSSSKEVALKVAYYKNKQKKIKADRAAKYNQNANPELDFLIPEINNLQSRQDITF